MKEKMKKEGRKVAGQKKKKRWKEKNFVVLEFPSFLSFLLSLLPPSLPFFLRFFNKMEITVVSISWNYCEDYMSIYLVQYMAHVKCLENIIVSIVISSFLDV